MRVGVEISEIGDFCASTVHPLQQVLSRYIDASSSRSLSLIAVAL
jgi:hypothetical protein